MNSQPWVSQFLHHLLFSTGALGHLEGCYDNGNKYIKWSSLNFSDIGERRRQRNLIILLWLRGYISRASYAQCVDMIGSMTHAIWNVGYDPNTERCKIYLEFYNSDGVGASLVDRVYALKTINRVFGDILQTPVHIDRISTIGFDFSDNSIDIKIYTHHSRIPSSPDFILPLQIKKYFILETLGSKRKKVYYQLYTPISMETLLDLCPFLVRGNEPKLTNIHIITHEGRGRHQYYYVKNEFDPDFFLNHPSYQALWNKIQSHLH